MTLSFLSCSAHGDPPFLGERGLEENFIKLIYCAQPYHPVKNWLWTAKFALGRNGDEKETSWNFDVNVNFHEHA
jgi:hypothetical protein